MSAPLDSLLGDLTSRNLTPSQTVSKINHALPDDPAHRDLVLSSSLANGADPLLVLCGQNGIDIPNNSIIILYILIARLALFLPAPTAQSQGNVVPPPGWNVVESWANGFDAERIRHCPKEVTILSKLIPRFAARTGNIRNAVVPLWNILRNFSPSLVILTTVHVQFLLTCAQARSYTSALPLLEKPIVGVGPSNGLSHSAAPSTDLTYQDVLAYHYIGGHILCALEKWSEAEEYFEAVVVHPGSAASAVQLEALKRMRLVQLIGLGECPTLPKQVHPNLTRLFRNTPYHAFVTNYPSNSTLLKALVDGTQQFGDADGKIFHSEKNSREIFLSDQNYGLVLEALKQAPKWELKKLTKTYVTLAVPEIGKLVGITDQEEVMKLVIGMIESNLINASISYDASGLCAVRFDDDEVQISKDQIDGLLRAAQRDSELLQFLDEETSCSKEYLSKAVKSRANDTELSVGAPGFPGGGMIEEELWNDSEMMGAY